MWMLASRKHQPENLFMVEDGSVFLDEDGFGLCVIARLLPNNS